MKTGKILKIALSMVKANKLRSWLTIIGVIIGIASVMAIVTTLWRVSGAILSQ